MDDTSVDESHGQSEHPRLTRAVLRAVASFCAGFAVQIVSLAGVLIADEEDGNRWFARGERAAYGFLAVVAALAVVILVMEL